MTPREATAVNVLLGYMVGKDELPPREVVFALEIPHGKSPCIPASP